MGMNKNQNAAIWLALAAACALPANVRAELPTGTDDEAWIKRQINSGMAPGLSARRDSARRIEFSDLSQYLGRRLRFVLNDGQQRLGIVTATQSDAVQVRAQFGSGFFLYQLPRSELRELHLD